MDDYQPRIVDRQITELITGLPALALDGPKAVGKTRTASRLAKTEFRLDESAERALAEADPGRLVRATPRPTLIDEWQRFPESWDLVRRAVDADGTPGQFILTGSASPRDQPTHSGAGRISSIRMRPLSFAERGMESASVSLETLLTGTRPAVNGQTTVGLRDYTAEILQSGFPGIRSRRGWALRTELDGYIQRIVEKDFPELGTRVRRPETLRRWMTAYGAATSTTSTWETIRDAASGRQGEKPTRARVIPYRETLEQLWVLDELPAWLPSVNHLGELAQAPKHHLTDPALAAALVGIDAEGLLAGRDVEPVVPRDGVFLGALFESLATLSVRVYAQASEAQVLHMRTQGGRHEIDLIVERRDQKVLAIEVKLSQEVDSNDVQHLEWLKTKIGDRLLDALVVTTGRHAFRRQDGVAVVPLALLGP